MVAQSAFAIGSLSPSSIIFFISNLKLNQKPSYVIAASALRRRQPPQASYAYAHQANQSIKPTSLTEQQGVNNNIFPTTQLFFIDPSGSTVNIKIILHI
eukprot:scaffold6230_cov151-Skeletonema_menzelii.AAC.11